MRDGCYEINGSGHLIYRLRTSNIHYLHLYSYTYHLISGCNSVFYFPTVGYFEPTANSSIIAEILNAPLYFLWIVRPSVFRPSVFTYHCNNWTVSIVQLATPLRFPHCYRRASVCEMVPRQSLSRGAPKKVAKNFASKAVKNVLDSLIESKIKTTLHNQKTVRQQISRGNEICSSIVYCRKILITKSILSFRSGHRKWSQVY